MLEKTHIDLIVDGSECNTQPVEVEFISPSLFRVLISPVFVEGIAADDIIRVTDEAVGKFRVIEYGGNVSVKISDANQITEKLPEIDIILSKVNARRDGNLKHTAVWTIPLEANFKAIEAAMVKACELLEEPDWWFGNIYDSQNNPINWWL